LIIKKEKEKEKYVSSSSEYSINHQDSKSRFIEEEQDSINHQHPKVDGTTRIFHHHHQKTQIGD